MSKRIRINANIGWSMKQDEATGHWIGVCPALKLTASGETHGNLIEAINESVNAIFQDLLDSGDLEEFLSLHGWSKQETCRENSESNSVELDVPWKMLESNDLDEAVC